MVYVVSVSVEESIWRLVCHPFHFWNTVSEEEMAFPRPFTQSCYSLDNAVGAKSRRNALLSLASESCLLLSSPHHGTRIISRFSMLNEKLPFYWKLLAGILPATETGAVDGLPRFSV